MYACTTSLLVTSFMSFGLREMATRRDSDVPQSIAFPTVTRCQNYGLRGETRSDPPIGQRVILLSSWKRSSSPREPAGSNQKPSVRGVRCPDGMVFGHKMPSILQLGLSLIACTQSVPRIGLQSHWNTDFHGSCFESKEKKAG